MNQRFLPENSIEAVLFCLVITTENLPLEASSLAQVISELVDVLVLHLSHHNYQVFSLRLALGEQVASKLRTFPLHFFFKLVFLVDLNIKNAVYKPTRFLPERNASNLQGFSSRIYSLWIHCPQCNAKASLISTTYLHA